MFRLDRFLTLYCFSPISKLRMTKTPAIPILMYHSISDELESGHPYFWINTSVTRFAEQMQFLKEKKYKVISLTDAVKILETAFDMPDDVINCHVSKRISSFSHSSCIPEYQEQQGTDNRFIVLTFDDGYYDFLEHAWPVLADHGFSATVFVSTGYISNDRKRFNGRKCLTWSEIRKLHRWGISFGSHTASHSNLYGMQWKEICGELLDSRLRLENELQTSVVEFAYPYAFPQEDQIFVKRFGKELIRQGYHIAVTTAIGRAKPGNNPLCLGRIPVNNSDDEKLFTAKIVGAYDWLASAQVIVRRTKQLSRSHHLFRTTAGT